MQTETITIQGHQFTVPVRYAEGHQLTAGEASALNQTFHENLRNNFASKVKDGNEAGVGEDVLQSQLDEYAASYQFGIRQGGGRSGDPIMVEAMSIARERIRGALKQKGKALKDYSAEQISTAARKLLDTQGAEGDIMRLARERVEAERNAASAAAAELSEIIDAIPPEPADEGVGDAAVVQPNEATQPATAA